MGAFGYDWFLKNVHMALWFCPIEGSVEVSGAVSIQITFFGSHCSYNNER
jgi:hypothetical protein